MTDAHGTSSVAPEETVIYGQPFDGTSHLTGAE